MDLNKKGYNIIKGFMYSEVKKNKFNKENFLFYMIEENNSLTYYYYKDDKIIKFKTKDVVGFLNYEGLKFLLDTDNIDGFLINNFKENDIDLKKNFIVYKIDKNDRLNIFVYDKKENKLLKKIVK